MDIPKAGDLIQHHKHSPENGHHHIYEVVAIAHPIPKLPAECITSLRVQHTEDGSTLTLAIDEDPYYIGPVADEWTEDHVVYWSLCTGKHWARPLSEFEKPLEDGGERFMLLSRAYPPSKRSPDWEGIQRLRDDGVIGIGKNLPIDGLIYWFDASVGGPREIPHTTIDVQSKSNE